VPCCCVVQRYDEALSCLNRLRAIIDAFDHCEHTTTSVLFDNSTIENDRLNDVLYDVVGVCVCGMRCGYSVRSQNERRQLQRQVDNNRAALLLRCGDASRQTITYTCVCACVCLRLHCAHSAFRVLRQLVIAHPSNIVACYNYALLSMSLGHGACACAIACFMKTNTVCRVRI
jgi:hypothetical protein